MVHAPHLVWGLGLKGLGFRLQAFRVQGREAPRRADGSCWECRPPPLKASRTRLLRVLRHELMLRPVLLVVGTALVASMITGTPKCHHVLESLHDP